VSDERIEREETMFDLINAYEEQQTPRETIRREVVRRNQARRARRQAANRHPFYATTLVGVGHVLVGVGSRLQERYGNLVDDAQPIQKAC
jgi:hypothetical protein